MINLGPIICLILLSLIIVGLPLCLLNKIVTFFLDLENVCFVLFLSGFNKKAVTDGHENGDLGTSSETSLEDSASKLDDRSRTYGCHSSVALYRGLLYICLPSTRL